MMHRTSEVIWRNDGSANLSPIPLQTTNYGFDPATRYDESLPVSQRAVGQFKIQDSGTDRDKDLWWTIKTHGCDFLQVSFAGRPIAFDPAAGNAFNDHRIYIAAHGIANDDNEFPDLNQINSEMTDDNALVTQSEMALLGLHYDSRPGVAVFRGADGDIVNNTTEIARSPILLQNQAPNVTNDRIHWSVRIGALHDVTNLAVPNARLTTTLVPRCSWYRLIKLHTYIVFHYTVATPATFQYRGKLWVNRFFEREH